MSNNRKIAIIDFGTNTFHLLMATILNKEDFIIDETLQIPVKLGEGGINNRFITRRAYQRGIEATQKIADKIQESKITQIRAVGTSMMRNATNSIEFKSDLEDIIGTEIEVINGNREAQLIYYGVRWAVGLWNEPAVIVDIGGGSVEFIIADSMKIYWKKSFEIGAARLIEMFPHNFPVEQESIEDIRAYLNSTLQEVISKLKEYDVKYLVGSSGSFETYTQIEINEYLDIHFDELPLMHPINLSHFEAIKNRILTGTKEEVSKIPGMAAFRVNMIVVSTLLTDYLLKEGDIENLYYSDYAVKQGLLWEYIQKEYKELT